MLTKGPNAMETTSFHKFHRRGISLPWKFSPHPPQTKSHKQLTIPCIVVDTASRATLPNNISCRIGSTSFLESVWAKFFFFFSLLLILMLSLFGWFHYTFWFVRAVRNIEMLLYEYDNINTAQEDNTSRRINLPLFCYV